VNGTSGNFNITVNNSVSAQFTLSNTGSPAAGNIAAGNNNAVLLSFSLLPANCNNNFDFTAANIYTSGTATSSDISNFRIIVDENSNGTADVSEIASPIATVSQLSNTLIFNNITNQANLTSPRRYLLIASVAANPTIGGTITCSLTSANTTASVTVSGSANGNTQTILIPTVTLTNTGSPAASSIEIGSTNKILFGFTLTPNISVDFTTVFIQTSGTATSSDFSNFRLIYDADANGNASASEISASLGTVTTLSSTLTFSGITGQTGFSAIRRYLLIADVSSGATGSRTFKASVASNNINTTAISNTGSAEGNTMTIVNIPAAGEIVINQFNPGYSSAGDEFVELLNTTGKTFDLSQLSIAYASTSGGSGAAGGTLSGTLQPYSFWLLSPNATITVGSTSSITRDGSITSGFAGTGGQIALLLNSNNTKIDGIGYGTLSGGTYFESVTAGNISSNSGFRRKVDGVDSDNNATDFSTIANSSIYLRNSSSRIVKTGINVPAATYRDLSVVGSASLSGNVILTGQLLVSNNATLTLGTNNNLTCASISGASVTNTISVSASNNISITGSGGSVFFNPSNNTLKNLTISGSGTTTLGNALNIVGASSFGIVTVGSGATLTTGGFLTLKSDANGTASIGNSAGTISGNVTVERFIPAQGKRYRFLSSPVSTTVADWRGEIFITGGGASSEFSSVGVKFHKVVD
jgi:hypothetical protein